MELVVNYFNFFNYKKILMETANSDKIRTYAIIVSYISPVVGFSGL